MSRYGDIMKVLEVSKEEVNKLLGEGWMLLDVQAAPLWRRIYIMGLPATFRERKEQIKSLVEEAS